MRSESGDNGKMNQNFNICGLIAGTMMWTVGPLAVYGIMQAAKLAGWMG